jgi:hypothetical protein
MGSSHRNIALHPKESLVAGLFPFLGRRLSIQFQPRVTCRVDKHPHDPTRQHPHTGNPQYVPEGGNQANEGAILRDHPRNYDNDRLGQTTPKGSC